MSLRKLTDSIGIKASGVFIMALQSDILDGRYGSIESRYLAKCEQVRNTLSLDTVGYRGKDL